MPSPAHHERRRREFLSALDGPVLLMAGGWIPRNYPANVCQFRADSTFLFFFPEPEPNAAALFDPRDESVTLYLDERTPADALWHGPVPSFGERQAALEVTSVEARSELARSVSARCAGRHLRALALHDPRATAEAAALSGEALDFHDPARVGERELLLLLARLRTLKAGEELDELRRAAAVTRVAHELALAWTRPGRSEQELVGLVEGTFLRQGCVPAYGTILSVRGEVLHNHGHANVLAPGDLVLLDAGAERPSGYCADVTRTWPANGRFSAEQRDVYDVVLASQQAALAEVRPGVRYREVHLRAARVLADGLVQLGLLRGQADERVESGAHALFFPPGVGHLLGLDVHDLEAFGDLVAYAPGRTRSPQFGTAYLRLDLDLEPGMCCTIEPGLYFVPAILHDPALRERFRDEVDFTRAERFLACNDGRGFGGIRIEDDVLCTADGCEVLSAAIPKERAALEALIGSAADEQASR
jgi:Xaa-Pro aminopeptidase/Xaa-Pro dipeptidase